MSDPDLPPEEEERAPGGDGRRSDAAGSSAVPAPPPAPSGLPSVQRALGIALAVTAATTPVIGYAFGLEQAGSASMLLALGALYALIGAFALRELRAQGELHRFLRPATGDLALGAVTAGALYGLAMLTHLTLTARGSPREGWIIRLYLQLGDPNAEWHTLAGGLVFLVAALEELVWRGLVMRTLDRRFGARVALLGSTALFAVAHLPTLYLLRVPGLGPNPLILLAALGCSFVWGLLLLRKGRLLPGLFAHAFFSWAVFEFPLWRP